MRFACLLSVGLACSEPNVSPKQCTAKRSSVRQTCMIFGPLRASASLGAVYNQKDLTSRLAGAIKAAIKAALAETGGG